MRTLYNSLVYFLVILLGSMIFPEYIVCDGWKMALQVTVIHVILAVIYCIAVVLLMLITIIPSNILRVITVISAFVLALASTLISLRIAEHIIEGFEVNGIFTYIAIMILTSMFSIKASKEDK